MADPIQFSLIFIATRFRHKWDGSWFHWMVVFYVTSGIERAICEIDPWLKGIKLWSWFIKFLSDPIEISTFFACITEKARLLSAIKIKRFITIDEFVHLVYRFIFKNLLSDEFESICGWNFCFYFLFSFNNKINLLLF